MVSQGGNTQHGPAGHWSAANPIPTIHKFVENLDKEKKERDKHIDEEIKRQEEAARKEGKPLDHKEVHVPKKSTREVTDPVTGKQIEIEDVQKQYLDQSKNPTVSYKMNTPFKLIIRHYCSLNHNRLPFQMPISINQR